MKLEVVCSLLFSLPWTCGAGSRCDSARAGLFELRHAIESYQRVERRYPEKLSEVVEKGYLFTSGSLTDPWGHPWVYFRRSSGYDLLSLGPDGTIGTTDDLRLGSSVTTCAESYGCR